MIVVATSTPDQCKRTHLKRKAPCRARRLLLPICRARKLLLSKRISFMYGTSKSRSRMFQIGVVLSQRGIPSRRTLLYQYAYLVVQIEKWKLLTVEGIQSSHRFPALLLAKQTNPNSFSSLCACFLSDYYPPCTIPTLSSRLLPSFLESIFKEVLSFH